jgi:hypothetical protein
MAGVPAHTARLIVLVVSCVLYGLYLPLLERLAATTDIYVFRHSADHIRSMHTLPHFRACSRLPTEAMAGYQIPRRRCNFAHVLLLDLQRLCWRWTS